MRTCIKCNGTGQVDDPLETGLEMRGKRMAADITQTAVSRAMGLHQTYVCELEIGRRSWNQKLKQRYLDAIAAILQARREDQVMRELEHGDD